MNFFLAAMIIISPFQIPDLAFAMAEDEPHIREVSEGRRPTRGTKRGRGGSGMQASEDDPLAPEVIMVGSEDEDPRYPQVSSFWIFLPAASYSFNLAGRVAGLRSCRSEQASPGDGGTFLEGDATGGDGLPDA